MKCFSCGKDADICLDYINRCYCKSCFIELLERRFKRELTKLNFNPKEEYYLLNTSTSFLAEFFLERVFKGLVKFQVVDEIPEHKSRKIIIPIFLEKVVGDFLDCMLRGKNPRGVVEEYYFNKRKIYLLKGILWNEIYKTSKILNIKNINMKKEIELNKTIIDILNIFYKSHWNSLFAASKTIEKLAEMIKNNPKK